MRKAQVYTALLLTVLLISGCAPYEEVKDVIYLQNAEIKAPLMQIPVFLSTSDTDNVFIIKPRIFLGNKGNHSTKIPGHSRVNTYGIFQVDTIFNGEEYYFRETPGSNIYGYTEDNYFLTYTIYNIGFDADLFLSKSFCLSGGVNFSSLDRRDLVSWRGGIGLKSFENSFGFRFDAGLSGQEIHYDVKSLIIREQKEWFGGNETLVIFTRDIGTQTNLGYYFNINLTYDPQFYIGGFLNAGYVHQKLLDIIPYEYDNEYVFWAGSYTQTDKRNEISSGFFNLSTGLLFNITYNIKLIGGVKYLSEVSSNDLLTPTVYPFVQLHFGI